MFHQYSKEEQRSISDQLGKEPSYNDTFVSIAALQNLAESQELEIPLSVIQHFFNKHFESGLQYITED
jgi:hypothetical protein